ncbi:hypothetical protein G5V59_21220 [Nocardioides sp. W3-2-3]|uniref:hypothetical protein n=1 Tax=Nocardioides convexus TaxID=2712224 RepID=UPI0024184918|nr:hypothetical protein [Nocardioides convexus]NHA01476.1 hypothetical protein [Nocardioides convexus]
MLLRRSAAACFGLLVLLPALAACGGDDGGIKVGDLVDARADDQFIEGGTASTVALPIGRLEISAGKPTTKAGRGRHPAACRRSRRRRAARSSRSPGSTTRGPSATTPTTSTPRPTR